jgi:hypothetical protein
MKIEHMLLINSVSYLPMPLRKLPEAFGLVTTNSWYPHYFYKDTNLNYVGPIPDVTYFGAYEMSISERREFMTWYDDQKNKVFDNKLVLQKYWQDYVTVLTKACQIFGRVFMEIGNIEIILESFNIASACNNVLRKRFLKPNTIGLIPAGGYSCNNNYSKKALMWLLHMEQMDGCRIKHARIGREYKPPELAKYSVDVYCSETKIIYEFWAVFRTGIPVNSFVISAQ